MWFTKLFITFRNIIPILCCRPNEIYGVDRIYSAFISQDVSHAPSLYILKYFSVRFVVHCFSFCLSSCLQPQLLSSFPEIEAQPSKASNPSDVITCRVVFLKKAKPSASTFVSSWTFLLWTPIIRFPNVRAQIIISYWWKFKITLWDLRSSRRCWVKHLLVYDILQVGILVPLFRNSLVPPLSG